MKKITKYFGCFLFAASLATVSFAQTSDMKQDQTYPKILDNKGMSERLQKDWSKRNMPIQNQPVQWFDLGEGYYGSYTNNNIKYLTLYDRDGNYIQTYRKSEWNTASASVKNQYDLSNYKGQEVTGYWEISDPGKIGYYFELKDDQGNPSRIWVNEAGEFANTVPKTKPKM